MQRNVRASQGQKCAAWIAKHPAADRGHSTITYWLYSTVNISCWSAARTLHFPAFECFGDSGLISECSQYNGWRRAGNSPCWAQRHSQERTHNLSIRCQAFPSVPSLLTPADPWKEASSQQPFEFTVAQSCPVLVGLTAWMVIHHVIDLLPYGLMRRHLSVEVFRKEGGGLWFWKRRTRRS